MRQQEDLINSVLLPFQLVSLAMPPPRSITPDYSVMRRPIGRRQGKTEGKQARIDNER